MLHNKTETDSKVKVISGIEEKQRVINHHVWLILQHDQKATIRQRNFDQSAVSHKGTVRKRIEKG